MILFRNARVHMPLILILLLGSMPTAAAGRPGPVLQDPNEAAATSAASEEMLDRPLAANDVWRQTKRKDFSRVGSRKPYAKIYNDTRKKVMKRLADSRRAKKNGKGGKADRLADEARDILKKGARQFIGPDSPKKPCGAYRDSLLRFRGLLGKARAALEKKFRTRIQSLDEGPCTHDLTGTWSVSPISGTQTCKSRGGRSWTEDEGSPEEYQFELLRVGPLLFGSYPELPRAAGVSGEYFSDGRGEYTFFFESENGPLSRSRSADCLIFHDSKAQDTVFGDEFCQGVRCEPVSCFETETIVGKTKPCVLNPTGGKCASVMESWKITVSYREFPDPASSESVLVVTTCTGSAESFALQWVPE